MVIESIRSSYIWNQGFLKIINHYQQIRISISGKEDLVFFWYCIIKNFYISELEAQFSKSFKIQGNVPWNYQKWLPYQILGGKTVKQRSKTETAKRYVVCQ